MLYWLYAFRTIYEVKYSFTKVMPIPFVKIFLNNSDIIIVFYKYIINCNMVVVKKSTEV